MLFSSPRSFTSNLFQQDVDVLEENESFVMKAEEQFVDEEGNTRMPGEKWVSIFVDVDRARVHSLREAKSV